MEFSPIVIQRKAAAPAEGSHNPFDDFDFIVPTSPGGVPPPSVSFAAAGAAPGSPIRTVATGSPLIGGHHMAPRHESFDSEDDPFNLFSDDSSSKPSPAKTAMKKRPSSGLRHEVRADSDEDDAEKDEDDADTDSGSPRPSMPLPPQEYTEAMIPFLSDDAELYKFLSSPLEPKTFLRMTMLWDDVNKIFKLIQDSTHRIVLTGMKRTDGLKAFSLSTNYSILMLPTDRAFALSRENSPSSRAGSMVEPVRIAKLRGNTLGSQYSLFDQGKSPSKAAGVLEVRRELMGVKFEVMPNIYTRRITSCYLPVPGQYRRPTSRDELLHERGKKNDPGVKWLSPYVPNSNKLPRLEDFQGFATTHSVKNFILHDPATYEVSLRFGRQADRQCYRLEFTHPFSVLSAFGLALASCDSKIHPNRQL